MNNETLISGYQTAKNMFIRIVDNNSEYDIKIVEPLLELLDAISNQIKVRYSKLDIRYKQYCYCVVKNISLLRINDKEIGNHINEVVG
jgi:hypothetical protein